MARHYLSLHIQEIYNEGLFIIEDTSIYTPTIPVSCMNLQITPPGFGTPTIYTPLASGFKFILNACTLGITNPTGCAQALPQVPDGIYILYYSVSPNDDVYVGYNYLRTTSAVNRLNNMLCDIGLASCLPDQEQLQMVNDIEVIRGYLRSAQTNVNDRKNPVDGMNQYRYAIQLMDKMSRRKPYCMNYGNGQIYG